MIEDKDQSVGDGIPAVANDNGERTTGKEDPRILRIAAAIGRSSTICTSAPGSSDSKTRRAPISAAALVAYQATGAPVAPPSPTRASARSAPEV